MKRSRACDDLVALAELTPASDWRRVKRSRANRSRSSSSGACCSDDSERHSLQFSLEMNELNELSELGVEATPLSSSAPASWTWNDDTEDDSLPLRRNSREQILRRRQQHKEQHRIAQLAGGSVNAAGHDDAEVGNPALGVKVSMAPPRLLSFLESPETPESRLLRACGFARESRCIDPLDKRQAQPFDMSAFIMLSISPKP